MSTSVGALSQGIGNVFSVDEDLLGATVLAWGETFPDLMAMIAVARAGQCILQKPVCEVSCLSRPGSAMYIATRILP